MPPNGPHAWDLELKQLVDILLSVNAQAYLIEAANARHEHEYAVWDTVQLPDGKSLAQSADSAPESGLLDLFRALEQQLGLKLESAKEQ